MEIVLRLHPALRDELREVAETSHAYREFVACIAAEAEALVARHGASIHYATIHLHGTPFDTAGAAASARALRPGVALVDVDPPGTALTGFNGSRMIAAPTRGPDGGSTPRHRRREAWRDPAIAPRVFKGARGPRRGAKVRFFVEERDGRRYITRVIAPGE